MKQLRMSAEEFRKQYGEKRSALKPGKKAKYSNEKIEVDGRGFHSKAEATLYHELKLRERAGEITNLRCQHHVRFKTEDHGKIHMIPDFSYEVVATGELRFAEFKGFETNDWLRKRKAWKVGGPAVLEVYKGKEGYVRCVEVITPGAP